MTFEPWMETAIFVVVIVIAALAIQLLIRHAATGAIRRLIERRALAREDVNPGEVEQRVITLQQLTVRVSGLLIAAIALLMVLAQVGIEIAPALAGLGVVGIAVGFGAQKLFQDWLAGIFIVLENQYSVGDVVTVAGVSGMVEDISLRRTLLRDLSGALHTVPNGQIAVASNLTADWSRVNLDVEVAYDTDIGKATGIIDRIGQELAEDADWGPKIIDPPAVLRVNELGESGVTLKMLAKVAPGEQWSVAGELRRRILATFASEGIEIPFPHRVMVSRDASTGN